MEEIKYKDETEDKQSLSIENSESENELDDLKPPSDIEVPTIKPLKSNYGKIFITNSSFNDKDDKLIEIMLECKLLDEYKCNYPKCKVKNTWQYKKIKLILARKNSVQNDLIPTNLELLCPNCYSISFDTLKENIIRKAIFCQYCKFNITKFGKQYTSKLICKTCSMNSMRDLEHTLQDEYHQELLKLTGNSNPEPIIKKPPSHKLKTSKSSKSNNIELLSNGNMQEIQSPIITINTNIDIKLEDLLLEDD
jgi:hypothetical protein